MKKYTAIPITAAAIGLFIFAIYSMAIGYGDKDRILAIWEMYKAYRTPIVFYGKVVDEKNSPIPGADVFYSVANNPLKDGPKYGTTSDADGLFSISGIKGAALSAGATKKGYYVIHHQSAKSFAYGLPPSPDIDSPIPTKDNPALFILRKMGETVPLAAIEYRDVAIPKDGTPVEISLSTGTEVPEGEGDLIVECRTKNQGLDPNLCEHYDWRFRLTIPDGGLVERKGEFDFIAPETGYRPALEVDMPKDTPEWKHDFQDEYFLKLRDNRHARLEFRFTSAGAHFASITSYLNPVPGDRNLEYDPEKEIK